MNMPDPERRIVRPFGLIGGDYEVDAAGLQKYRLSWVLVAVVFGFWGISRVIDLPVWLVVVVTVGGMAAIFALCADVARKGRKL